MCGMHPLMLQVRLSVCIMHVPMLQIMLSVCIMHPQFATNKVVSVHAVCTLPSLSVDSRLIYAGTNLEYQVQLNGTLFIRLIYRRHSLSGSVSGTLFISVN